MYKALPNYDYAGFLPINLPIIIPMTFTFSYQYINEFIMPSKQLIMLHLDTKRA